VSDDLVRKTVMPGGSRPALSKSKSDLVRSSEVTREFLAFELGGENYALPLSSIREILKPPPVTGVPRASRDVIGIISVRGRITTVIDLRRRLNLAEAKQSKASRILLVDREDEIIGVLVDGVHQVYRLDPEEVEYSSVMGSDASDHFMGIGRPRVARGSRGASAVESEDAILILLDPIPLLRR
jgi:purine-binding chemotaxis protein CheW